MAEHNRETAGHVLEVDTSEELGAPDSQLVSPAESANEPSDLEVSPEGLIRPPNQDLDGPVNDEGASTS
jgi:hypothetical protein